MASDARERYFEAERGRPAPRQAGGLETLGAPGPSPDPPGRPAPVRVLCIGATGQSGSTLLSRLLGRLPGFVAVGEVGRIWDKGLVEDMACGCGRPFRSCPFWTSVGREAFGGWDEIDLSEAIRLRDAVTLKSRRLPHAVALPFILHPDAWPALREDLIVYGSLLGRVYRALDRIAQGRIVVDSMKLPGHVYLASTLEELDVRVAHLTRDPRGYAFSNTRWIPRQGAIDGAFRARRSARKSAVKWTWCNLAFAWLARTGTTTAHVRYEDLVRDPAGTLRRIATTAGVELTGDDLSFLGNGEVELATQHIAAGSRGRMATGWTPLVADEEWRRSYPARDRHAVEALTWPLRRGYGYGADERAD